MDIDLAIEGALDPGVADAIRRRVRQVSRQFSATGEWRIAVCPGETGGLWDVGIHAPSGWRIESFADPVDGLPAFVEQKLREYVQPPVTDTLDPV
jgi:hypothetical protein